MTEPPCTLPPKLTSVGSAKNRRVVSRSFCAIATAYYRNRCDLAPSPFLSSTRSSARSAASTPAWKPPSCTPTPSPPGSSSDQPHREGHVDPLVRVVALAFLDRQARTYSPLRGPPNERDADLATGGVAPRRRSYGGG